MKTSSIFKNSIANSIYTGISLLFPIISAMYVSRILLANGIGKVAYAQNIVSYFVTLAQLGIMSLGIREIAKVRDDNSATDKVFSELFMLNAGSTTLAVLLYGVLLYFKNGFSDWPLSLSAGLLIFFNFFNIDWFFQGIEKYSYIVIRSFIVKVLALFALFIFLHHKNDYVIFALITSLALGANNLFNMAYSRHFVKLSFRHIEPLRFIKPMLILSGALICSTLYSQIDTTMLGYLTDDTAVGWYTYSHKIAFICVTISVAISRVFYPRLSYYYKNNREELMRLVNMGFEALSFLTFPICAGLLILAPFVLVLLFGHSFAPAGITLRIFVPIVFIQSFGNLLCYQLMLATDNEKKQLPILFLGTIANALLNVFLIPIFAQNGAAVASVFTEFLINILQFIYIKRYLGFHLRIKPFMFGFLNSVLLALLLWTISQYISISWISIIGIVCIGGIFYLLINIVEKNSILFKLWNKINHMPILQYVLHKNKPRY